MEDEEDSSDPLAYQREVSLARYEARVGASCQRKYFTKAFSAAASLTAVCVLLPRVHAPELRRSRFVHSLIFFHAYSF